MHIKTEDVNRVPAHTQKKIISCYEKLVRWASGLLKYSWLFSVHESKVRSPLGHVQSIAVYPCFCNIKQLGVFHLFRGTTAVLPSALDSPVPIYTLRQRETVLSIFEDPGAASQDYASFSGDTISFGGKFTSRLSPCRSLRMSVKQP